MANLQGTRKYMATIERTNTCNEVHRKLVDLNLGIMLIDQELKTLIQDCSKRDEYEDYWFLSMAVQQMMGDQERMKQRLREFLVRCFQPNCPDIRKLEGFILEQEVYRCLSSIKTDNGFKILLAQIEEFTRSVDERNKKVYDLKTKNLKLAVWERSQSGYIPHRIPPPQGFKTRNLGDISESLNDVVVKMYGFPVYVASDIKKSLASQELVSGAFKINVSKRDDIHRKGEDGFDPMDFLDPEVLSRNCEVEDAETLKWNSVRISKEIFEEVIKGICYEDERNVAQALKGKMQQIDYSEILKAIRNWVFHMESVLCTLIHNCYAMISGCEPGRTKFKEFKSVLKEMKKRGNGLVPIIVYKVLAMPEIPAQTVESDHKIALIQKEMEFDQVIDTFQLVILLLGSVLSKTSELQATNERSVLISCRSPLHRSEELLKEIGMKIDGAKSRLEGWIKKIDKK